jgi:hypothetical protein
MVGGYEEREQPAFEGSIQMSHFAGKCVLRGICLVVLVLLLSPDIEAGCWESYPQSVIANSAPIIVLGEITAIDTAKAEGKDREKLRYLDGARIKVERVCKNALSDLPVERESEILVWMHSTNLTIPGSETKEGQHLQYQTSTDIRYKMGARGIWFLFLKADGKLYINVHPQQCIALEKEARAPDSIPLGSVGDAIPWTEWAKRDKSNLRK